MEYKTSSHIYHRSNWTWRSLVYLASCLVSIFLSREPYFLPWNSFKINWSLAPESYAAVSCFLKKAMRGKKELKKNLEYVFWFCRSYLGQGKCCMWDLPPFGQCFDGSCDATQFSDDFLLKLIKGWKQGPYSKVNHIFW